MRHPAGKSAIDVGFDGIGQNKIGLDLFQNRSVLVKELAVMKRIHAPPVDGKFNHAVSQMQKLIPAVIVRNGNCDAGILFQL